MRTMKTTNPETVLAQLGIKTVGQGQREIAAHCPFHTDRHPSFSMNAQTGLWICYQCSASGTLPMLVEMVGGKGESPQMMLRELRRSAQRKKLKPEPEPQPEPEVDPFVIFAKYEAFGRPPGWALDERRITKEIAKRYGVRWGQGWVIPIWSPEPMPALWGWQFKRLDYVSNYPKAVKKSTTLFGYRELESDTVVLVESPLDVLRLAAVGVAAVAAYGAYVSNAQVTLLVEYADHVILALDNDKAGVEQTQKLFPKLCRRLPTTRVVYPEGIKDPGDMTDKQARKLIDF
jgi:hypothetical protein